MNVSQLVEFHGKVKASQRLTLDDLAQGALSEKDIAVLKEHTSKPEDMTYMQFSIVPFLTSLTQEMRDRVFNFAQQMPWGDARFTDYEGDKRPKHPGRWAAALFPIPELLDISEQGRANYAEIADTKRGYSSEDGSVLFPNIAKGLKALSLDNKEKFLGALARIQKRHSNAMRIASGNLPDLINNYEWSRVEERYVKPIVEVEHDLPGWSGVISPTRCMWTDMPEHYATSLVVLVKKETNLVPIFLEKMQKARNMFEERRPEPNLRLYSRFESTARSRCDSGFDHQCRTRDIMRVTAVETPGILAEHPEAVDNFMNYMKNFADDERVNFIGHYMGKILNIIKKKDIDRFFEFVSGGQKGLDNLSAAADALDAYPEEGFRAFERLKELYAVVPKSEDGIARWIKEGAQKQLGNGLARAKDYVEFMKPLVHLEHERAREVFHKCEYLFDQRYAKGFPNTAVRLVQTQVYRAFDEKTRYGALHFLEELLIRGKKENGQEMAGAFIGALEYVNQTRGVDFAKTFITDCQENNDLRQTLGLWTIWKSK